MEELNPQTLRIYPNPNKGDFSITRNENLEVAHIQIFYIQGMLVYEEAIQNADHAELSLSLPKGVYFVTLNSS